MGLDVCVRWIIGYVVYKKKDLYNFKSNLVEVLD